MIRKWSEVKIKDTIRAAAKFYTHRNAGGSPPKGFFFGEGERWEPLEDEWCPYCSQVPSSKRFKHAYSIQHVVCSRTFGISKKLYKQRKEELDCLLLSMLLEHELASSVNRDA